MGCETIYTKRSLCYLNYITPLSPLGHELLSSPGRSSSAATFCYFEMKSTENYTKISIVQKKYIFNRVRKLVR